MSEFLLREIKERRLVLDTVNTALQTALGAEVYGTWLNDAAVEVGDYGVRVRVKSSFIKDFLEREYGEVMTQGIQAVCGPVCVGLVVDGSQGNKGKAEEQGNKGMAGAAAPVQGAAKGAAVAGAPMAEESRLDQRYRFESYVTGTNNQFAVAAARRVAEGGEKGVQAFNPLFIYGKVGLGKTHLMQAIGWELKNGPDPKRVVYVSAEQFVFKFVKALRDKSVLNFKDLFRNVDALLIDDVQFIAGKEASQEEFFHTFNALVGEGKQVILTADRSPHELDNIEDRLKSRLGSGLTVEVKAPDVETRLAILSRKAEQIGLELDREVLMYLAQNIVSNVRELEGALNRLAAFASLTGAEITIAFAREQLADLLRQTQRVVTIDDIKEAVADVLRIKLSDMVGPGRPKPVAEARQIAMWMCKQLTPRSYPEIGRAFGGRDHTTVMHAVQKVAKELPKNPDWQEVVGLVEKRVS